MADLEVADILAHTLTNLQLLPDLEPKPSRCFHVFPKLPTELRLKIFKQALPEPSALHLTAEVVVSDPSFGLYLTFTNSSLVNSDDNPSYWGKSAPIDDIESLKRTRLLSLLATTRESRELYLSVFRIALPFALNKRKTVRKGSLYISKEDALHWDNFRALMIENSDFRTAMKHAYRLQDWWGQIENIAIPIECFIVFGTERSGPRCNELLVMICLKMTGLKRLDGVMWKGFQKLQNGPGKDMIETSMKNCLAATESAFRKHEKEVDSSYKRPELHLII